MRPLKLDLVAFGPFLELQSLELSGLKRKRLFLIHGPVGSGKTFLLDGICFALFGRSSGGERRPHLMRSVNAPKEVDTLARLDFEVSSGCYRVERRLLPTKEDEGEAVEEARLWQLPVGGEPSSKDELCSSAPEVEQEIERLIGLKAGEFCQLVVLPQGQFQQFLMAEPEERCAILGRIFGLQLYRDYAAKVASAYLKIGRSLAAVWQERDEITKAYSEHSSDPRQGLMRSQEELEAVEREQRTSKESSARWERSLVDATRYETIERQKDMAERELQAIDVDSQEGAHLVMSRLDEALVRFIRLGSLEEKLSLLEDRLASSQGRFSTLNDSRSRFDDEFTNIAQREEERYRLLQLQGRLRDAGRELEGLGVLALEIAGAKASLAELQRVWVGASSKFKADKKRSVKIAQKVEYLPRLEVRLAKSRQELEGLEAIGYRLSQRRQIAEAIEQVSLREVRLKQTLGDLEQKLRGVKANLQRAKAQNLSESLMALREMLRLDEECPLCGSCTHPKPFQLVVDKSVGSLEVGDDEIVELQSRIGHVVEELSQCDKRRARFEGRLDELVGDAMEEQELTIRITKLRDIVSLEETRLAGWDLLKSKGRKLEEHLKLSRHKLKEMQAMQARLQASLEAASARRDWMTKRVREVLGESWLEVRQLEDDSILLWLQEETRKVDSQLTALEEQQYSSSSARQLAEELATAIAEQKVVEQELIGLQAERDELKDSLLNDFRTDFASWDDLYFALGRRMKERRIMRGQEPVLSQELLSATVRRQLEQAKELLKEVPKPELGVEQTRLYLSRERERVADLTDRQASLKLAMEQGLRDVARYDAVVENIRGLERKKELLAPIALALEGENSKGITFMRWVLGRHLGKVVAAANVKLELLAPRSFLLSLNSDLELEVFDIKAGLSRLASTLSGGECFLASLCLALGLAEMVQGSESVSARLQTMFIDEGFGNLDSQALDAVLSYLENMPEVGYSLGLVSHVPQLRERIADQIKVSNPEPGNRGSRLEILLS